MVTPGSIVVMSTTSTAPCQRVSSVMCPETVFPGGSITSSMPNSVPQPDTTSSMIGPPRILRLYSRPMPGQASFASTLVVILACSGGKPRPPVADDARHVTPPPSPRDGAPPTGVGDVQVRVEWKNVPLAARSSPGRTPCDTPRAPTVTPTTTWGVPGAAVLVEGVTKDLGEARIVLAGCALAPRVA